MPITITIRNNGPLFISADDAAEVILQDHEGNRVIPTAKPGKGIALCRCGASVNKPFCDGTHSRIGFQGARAAQEAFDRPAAEGAPVVSAAGAAGAESGPGQGASPADPTAPAR